MSLDVVLAMLANSYTTPEEKERAHRELMNASIASAVLQPKAPKPAKVKLPKIVAEEKDKSIAVPWTGSGDNDHAAFLANYRKAKTRDEYIAAIAQYVGYNTGENFGGQEYRALSAAKTATTPKVENPIIVHRRIDASISGFVAGMPDHRKKDRANLLAREVKAVDAMRECEKAEAAALAAGNESEASIQRSLAIVERERLIVIRRDLNL